MLIIISDNEIEVGEVTDYENDEDSAVESNEK